MKNILKRKTLSETLSELDEEITFINRIRQSAITNRNGGTTVFAGDAAMLERVQTTLLAVKNLLHANKEPWKIAGKTER